MTNIIVYITFIPWFCYFIASCKNALKILNKNKLTIKWMKKNFLSIFHFDNLILFAIFIYFSYYYPDADQIWLVEVLLFGTIHLYLYFNRMHDKDNKKGKMGSKDMHCLPIIFLFAFIPLMPFMIKKDYLSSYYMSFAFGFFHYLFVIIAKIINEKIITVLSKKHEE